MGRPSTFTDADIRTIGVMRAQGASWRAIGAHLGRADTNCRLVWVERLRQPGGWARPRGPRRVRNRPPFPAGSPVSWGAISLPILEAVLTANDAGRPPAGSA